MEKSPELKPKPENKPICEGKLFDATSLKWDEEKEKWKRNELLFEIVDRVSAELSKFPEFIGVFPFGSQTKGYNTEDSDVDIHVLVEKPKHEFDTILKAIENEYNEKGLYIDFILGTVSERQMLLLRSKGGFLNEDMCFLWRQGRGPKIKFWRDEMRKAMKNLSEEDRIDIFNGIVDYFVEHDKKSLSKMEKRATKLDKEEWLSQRYNLWWERIYNLIFQPEQK
jgi:predicted nucleotidyltransferase